MTPRTAPRLAAMVAMSASACLPAFGQMLPWPGEALPELPRLYGGPVQAQAGDLDGDGREDIVFGSSYVGPGVQNLIIMYSKADGFEIVEFPATGFHTALAIGDFDGDGRPDIAARSTNGETTVYFQQAGGSFAPTPSLPFGTATGQYSSLLARDLNDNGRSELVVVDYFYFPNDPYEEYTVATVSWTDGVSEPTITYSSVPGADYAQYNTTRSFVDWNGDGALDLIATGQTVTVALANSDEDPFNFGPSIQVRSSIQNSEYRLADANGDGVDDLLTIYTASDDSFVELLGPSKGITIPTPHLRNRLTRAGSPGPGGEQMITNVDGFLFPSVLPILNDGQERDSSFIVPRSSPPLYADRLVVADVNGDGRDDLVFYYSSGNAPPVIYAASNTAETMPRYRSELLPYGGTNVHVTDLNGNGTLDVVSGGYYTMRDAAGRVTEVRTGAGNGPYFEGDFDGNGVPDIGNARWVSIHLNPGGPLGTQSFVQVTTGTATPKWAIGVDMDGDNIDEIVVSTGGMIKIFRLEQGSPVLVSEVPGDAERMFEYDVNRDGHPDIVGVGRDGELIAWINNGAGSLLPAWVVAEDFGFNGNPPVSIAMGDIDGDGYDDFVGTNRAHSITGTARIVWGGPGGFSAVQPVDFDYKLNLVRIADVDGDGLSEIIASQVRQNGLEAYSGIAILKQVSPRQFQGVTKILGNVTQSYEFADMNRDGVMDAVINTDQQFTRIIYGATAPPAPCPADINADGLVNFSDLIAYLGLFNVGDAGADLVEPIGVVNFTDFVAYLAAFNAGCP